MRTEYFLFLVIGNTPKSRVKFVHISLLLTVLRR